MSDLVGNPEEWFSHNEAQIIIDISEEKERIKLDEPCGEKQWYRSACLLKLKLRDLIHHICKDSHGGMAEPAYSG